jgi:hypothetical protein
MAASGQSRRFLHIHAMSGYPPKLTVKAHRTDRQPWTKWPGSSADFGKLIADETEKCGQVIKFADIKSQRLTGLIRSPQLGGP